MTTVRAAGLTDTGRRRQKNDDSVLVDDRIFAVADGMGGYTGGEVASRTAVEALQGEFRRAPDAAGLESAVLAAGDAVNAKSLTDPDLRQMGTTLSVAALVDSPDGEVFAIAHVGDSRIYLLRDGELSQLTDDHTVSEEMKRAGQLSEAEAANDRRRHMLTRVLSASTPHTPDIQTLVPYQGDRLLLCSDGLYNEVADDDIARTLRSERDPDVAARQLVDMANHNGGGDNISVVIVDVIADDDRSSLASAALAAAGDPRTSTPAANKAAPKRGLMTAEERNAQLRQLARGDVAHEEGPAPWETGDGGLSETELPTRRITPRVALFLIVVLAVLGAAFGAVWWYATSSYFVGLDEGRVAIFKGRPGGLLFIEPTVVEETDLTAATVPPARAADVERGHETASLEDAQRYVRNLRRDSELLSPTSSAPPTSTAPAPPTSPTPPATAAP